MGTKMRTILMRILLITGLVVGLSACKHIQKEEADIIVVDPTTGQQAWTDTRSGLIHRVQNAFGSKWVGDKEVGSGATGNVSVIIVGSDTNITSSLDILTYTDLINFRDSLYGDQVGPRAKDIYTQLLNGTSDSLWKRLVTRFIKNQSVSKFDLDACTSQASVDIAEKQGTTVFKSVLKNISQGGTTSDTLGTEMCQTISNVASQMVEIDRRVNTPHATCNEDTSKNPKGCSDILGAAEVIADKLHDSEGLDKRDLGNETTLELNACVLYASDMAHYDNDGPTLFGEWDLDNNTGTEAIQQGKDEAQSRIPDGYPNFSGGSEVYAPYLGHLTDNHPRSKQELREMKFYWSSFFKETGANLKPGTRNLCIGNELHNKGDK